MVGNKNFKIVVLLILLVVSLVGCKSVDTSKDDKIKIGITQITEHPALDLAREGFIKALEDNGFEDGNNIEIDFQSAQGDIPTSQTIAQNFVSQNKDMIFAIATPSAQSAFNSTNEIPILITAVTDPVEAGIVKSIEKTQTNVTGTSDITPVNKQFELIKKLVPNSKKVGIIYNTSEINSKIQVDMAKEEAKKIGFDIEEVGVSSVNEVSQAMDKLIQSVDVVYTPADNIVASSMSLIANKCNQKNIPIIGAEESHVKLGALATEGIDYNQLGYETGLMAVQVLNGEKPQDMSIQHIKNTTLVINEKVAKMLDIEIPDDLKAKAQLIKGDN
ncbi:ABC transporter substrate-binding protein [Tepidibacter hydrothermalis]|uniref:ABC transporter substrate-binding protein n=1 Tax=Tepidibacter hydrothermalis TaxID=3036126 RepID=A0ABY8ECU0_9FIRM|nr:ABC transporter substrate-binding protein [Tepidibacter hydrothermalis]WFD10736.1 ABC transporter substrate-binding protein [Tepidibacter hydrothermalis]